MFSIFEEEGGGIFNTLVAVGPQGYAGKYQKRDLYYKADYYFAHPGESPFVLETPWGNFGVLICLDMIVCRTNWYQEYREMGVDAVIVSMNWDDAIDSDDPAPGKALEMAIRHGMDIYVSDSSRWDGTGLYLPTGRRSRGGLPSYAVGVNGISLHVLNYRKCEHYLNP